MTGQIDIASGLYHFVVAFVLPTEQHIVAVGHNLKRVVRHFHARREHLIFPHLVAGPVIFLQNAGYAAIGRPGVGQAAMPDQIAVRQKFTIKRRGVARPFIDDITVHIHEICNIGLQRSDKGVAVKSFAFIAVQKPQRTAERLIGSSGRGQGQSRGRAFPHAFHTLSHS